MARTRVEIEGLDDPIEDGVRDHREHPLFPLEKPNERVPDISFIQVTRRQDGAMVWGPVIASHELTSTEQISERWGGGFYELWGRAESKHFPGQPGNLSRKRTYTLPGLEKPFADRPTLKERIASGLAPESGGQSQTAPAAAPSVASPLGDSAVLIALMNMQQQSAQQSQQMMVTFMTMFMKMIESSKAEAQQQQQSMLQMMTTLSATSQNSMLQVLPLLVSNRGGGPEEMAKYAELFRALRGGSTSEDEKPSDPSGMLENIADIVAGAPAAIASLQALKAAGPPPGMGEPAPNGSAASVLGGIG